MDDDRSIVTITLSYLIVILGLHVIFFWITLFDYRWSMIFTLRHLFDRYFRQTPDKKNINTENPSALSLIAIEQPYTTLVHVKTSSSSNDGKTQSSIYFSMEHDSTLLRTIRTFGLLLCTCLLMTNWLRLGIFLLPQLYPHLIVPASNLCVWQGFLLHVLSLFHLHLTVAIRLFWHFCFTFEKCWQTVNYRRLMLALILVFAWLCILTWPSTSYEWASIVYDRILNICIVNYAFHLSYTLFVSIFTCLIPLTLVILSHRWQRQSIQRRLARYLSTLMINQQQSFDRIDIHTHIRRFICASHLTILWLLVNIVLVICIHVPMNDFLLAKRIVYYLQLIGFFLDPILYIIVFRSLSILILLRPTSSIYF